VQRTKGRIKKNHYLAQSRQARRVETEAKITFLIQDKSGSSTKKAGFMDFLCGRGGFARDKSFYLFFYLCLLIPCPRRLAAFANL
jgi:hypothetical protein